MGGCCGCCDKSRPQSYARSYATVSRARRHTISKQHTKSNTIGFSVGGAKDVNSFRECIEKNIMPSIGSITYNGLLYQYQFDTETKRENENMVDDKKNENDGSMLFYPSYCYAKIKKINFLEAQNLKMTKTNEIFEYYMSVGLNSNIKEDDFKRKHLNLIIVLDQSGSMGSSFYNDSTHKTKMEVANEACVVLLDHLTNNDCFGMVLFDDKHTILQKLQSVENINMDKLKKKILSIQIDGGTNFDIGYAAAIALYVEFYKNKNNIINNKEYENRIIFITDAQPNYGKGDKMMKMVPKYAENNENKNIDNIPNHIYTTFIGVGLDFNANLIEKISSTRGCNYYSVKSTKDFLNKMNEEFEFMVTPLVFNVCLKLLCEGNSCLIDKVYGSHDKMEKHIIENGEITRINTLFPSKKDKNTGEIQGGIQLIKLKKCNNNDEDINVMIEVSFQDRNDKNYKNIQSVTFEEMKSKKEREISDMIENSEEEEEEYDIKNNFYDNNGIRKAILLCKYCQVIRNWIKCVNVDGNQETLDRESSPFLESSTVTTSLKLDEKYKTIFTNFLNHFKKEMETCNDDKLQKEVDLMEKLLNIQ